MALTDPAVLLSAIASGIAVVAVTWLADRIGGTLGGLLATAPVTTAAAMLYLASGAGNEAVGSGVLHGGKSLFAAIAAMPVYFYVQKWMTDPVPLAVRIVAGLVLYVAAFTAGTLVADVVTPEAWTGVWVVATLALVAVYARTFFRVQIPPRLLRGKQGPMTAWEGLFRFLAGAGVILLVTALRDTDPLLTTAWAVFPGTFLVTLGVLGFRKGAAFSARAAQGGGLGGPPLVAYLLTLWMLLPLRPETWWTWLTQVPAWGAYLLTMWPLWRWQVRVRLARQAARQAEGSGAPAA